MMATVSFQIEPGFVFKYNDSTSALKKINKKKGLQHYPNAVLWKKYCISSISAYSSHLVVDLKTKRTE